MKVFVTGAIADGATAVVAALDAPGGVYNIVDDEPLTWRDYAAGASSWLPGPGRATRLFGDRRASLTRSLRVANGRFRDATGWAPACPSAREGWAATASILRS